jgi:Ca-activated chloride channel family protein
MAPPYASVTRSALEARALCLCALLVGVLASASFSAERPAQDSSRPYVISKDVNLVVVPVLVSDKNGRFVSGLDASNFSIFENGRPQQITFFRNEDIPVTAGLVVDNSGSMAAWRPQVIDGAKAFVQLSNQQDREFVVNFTNTITLGLPPNVPFTNNVDMLGRALSGAPSGGTTALYDATTVALQHLQADDHQKRVLILISDGGDNASKHSFDEVLRMAQAANVIIYAVGLLDENSADQNPAVLKKLAKQTGGQAYFPASASDVVDVCKAIAADIRHQYTLGYNPPNEAHSGYQKIRVRVTARGRGKLTVRSRTGYFLVSKNADLESPEEQSLPLRCYWTLSHVGSGLNAFTEAASWVVIGPRSFS